MYPRPQRSQRGRCYAFGCLVAIRGGYRMARGWHYTKLSLSSTLLSFSGMCILLLFFSFLFVVFVFCCCVFLLLSLELCRCSSDLFLSSRPRIRLATTYITGPDRLFKEKSERTNNNWGLLFPPDWGMLRRSTCIQIFL